MQRNVVLVWAVCFFPPLLSSFLGRRRKNKRQQLQAGKATFESPVNWLIFKLELLSEYRLDWEGPGGLENSFVLKNSPGVPWNPVLILNRVTLENCLPWLHLQEFICHLLSGAMAELVHQCKEVTPGTRQRWLYVCGLPLISYLLSLSRQ